MPNETFTETLPWVSQKKVCTAAMDRPIPPARATPDAGRVPGTAGRAIAQSGAEDASLLSLELGVGKDAGLWKFAQLLELSKHGGGVYSPGRDRGRGRRRLAGAGATGIAGAVTAAIGAPAGTAAPGWWP